MLISFAMTIWAWYNYLVEVITNPRRANDASAQSSWEDQLLQLEAR